MYKCESCGKEDSHPENFRLIAGSILLPDKGGLIGGNIATGKKEKWERQRKVKISRSKDKSLRVYGMIYCADCYLKASGFSKDGKNKYAIEEESEEEPFKELLFSKKENILCIVNPDDESDLWVLNGCFKIFRHNDIITIRDSGEKRIVTDWESFTRKEFDKKYPEFTY